MNMKKLIYGLPVIYSTLIGCGTNNEDNPRDRENNSTNDSLDLRVDSLSDFGTDNILIFSKCDQVENYARGLKDTARRYSRFNLSKVNSTEWQGSYGDRDITVGCRDSNIEGSYDIVNVRGHTGDMRALISEADNFFEDHTTLILGGCDSSIFISEYAKRDVAVIAGSGVQDTANNNYLILQLPKAIDTNTSWDSLDTYMISRSDRWGEFDNPSNYTN